MKFSYVVVLAIFRELNSHTQPVVTMLEDEITTTIHILYPL